MKVLVTGADGMLGRRVVAAARAAGHDATGIDVADVDITDAPATERVVGRLAPDAVVNCAAYTRVDDAEADEALATRVNGEGAGNVARAATAAGARVVHVSTDYVFDGMRTDGRPYVESDPPSPRSAYGRSKLAGERAVAVTAPDHAIARTAWLFGAGGPNFVDTMLRLARERETVAVVTDQGGSPSWTGHLAPALVALCDAAMGTGVFHAAGDGRCSWHELAVETYARAGSATRVEATTTESFPRPAPRPAWSVLATEREPGIRLPPWQEGLAGHLEETLRT